MTSAKSSPTRSMEYLKDMPIVVLGGGTVGNACVSERQTIK